MIAELATSPWVRALALALLHFVWQGAALALLVRLTLAALGPKAAKARYAASCGALLAAALLPVITAIVSLEPRAGTTVPIGQGGAPSALSWQHLGALFVVGLWALGALFRLVSMGHALQKARRLVSLCRPLRDEIATGAGRLAARMGLVRVPRLLEGTHFDVPMAVGWLRPVVLVPVSAITTLAPAELDALIAHELAHVARYDFFVNVLQEVVASVLFFHPAVHYIGRTIREAREHVADDLAASCVSPKVLARALFSLESCRYPLPELPVGSNGGDLVNRIQRLIRPDSQARRSSVAALLLAGAALSGALWGLGSCGATPDLAPPILGPEAQTEVRIRWLPPALEPYRGLFETAARKHGVDADVLAIVTLLESAGDPAARSPNGALGLMQIMPGTGAQIALERGDSGFDVARLKDPSVNIDFGAYYFATQAAAFAPDENGMAQVALAAAAYNAGPKALKAYLAQSSPLPEETVRYQSMVVALYEERALDRSPTFEGWRERVRARAAEKAVPLLTGARVTASFGAPAAHTGVDLAAKSGTEIAAPLDGEVVSTEEDQKRGLAVVVRHAGGLETRYHHLDSIRVKAGDHIRKGATLGTVGATGVVTGPHVHFEVRDLGAPIDPSPFVGEAGGASTD